MKRGEDPFQSFLVLLNSVCNPNQNSGAGGLARSPNLTMRENPGTSPLQISRISNPIFTLSTSFNYLNTVMLPNST